MATITMARCIDAGSDIKLVRSSTNEQQCVLVNGGERVADEK